MRKIQIKKHGLYIIFWFVTGLVISLSAGAMMISRSLNLSCFFDAGDVYEIAGKYIEPPGNGISRVEGNEGVKRVDAPDANKSIFVPEKNWKYWAINVGNLSNGKLDVVIDVGYQNESEKRVIDTVACTLYDGMNVIEWEGEPFTYLVIHIPDQEGSLFWLNSIVFWERHRPVRAAEYLRASALVFICYLFFTGMMFLMLRKRERKVIIWDSILYFYQDVVLFIFNHFSKGLAKLPSGVRRVIRSGVFIVWITWFIFIENSGLRNRLHSWHYLIAAAAILILSCMSVESRLERVQWDKTYVGMWCLYWGLTCISDFFVIKRWGYVGYIFLFLLPAFFVIWGNMKKKTEIIEDMINALHISFFGWVLFSICFRPLPERIRYAGALKNPNSFSFCLIMAAVAVIAGFWKYWKKDRWSNVLIVLAVELDLVFFFLGKTQTRSVTLTLAFCLALVTYFWKAYWHRKKFKKKALLSIALVVILMIPVSLVTDKAMHLFSAGTETETAYMQEEMILDEGRNPFGATEVMAAERLIRNFKNKNIDVISNGRITIWNEYLRKMNLMGHEERLKMNDEYTPAHNSFLAVASLYGVITVIPYIMLWLLTICKSFQRRMHPIQLFLFLFLLSFFMIGMLDAVEHPWRHAIWIVAYILMGDLFQKKDEYEN